MPITAKVADQDQQQDPKQVRYDLYVPYTDPSVTDADGNPVSLFRKVTATQSQVEMTIKNLQTQKQSIDDQIALEQQKLDAISALA